MDQREAELNTSSISNTTRSVFYCPHDPQLVWDLRDTTSPWIFAAVASIMSGAPSENIVQNHLNMALLNVF